MSSSFPARRRFGQHFLVDRSAVDRIVAALAPTRGEAVLEIGPGRGALTGTLVERAGRLAAVELDRELAAALRRRFAPEVLSLWQTDVLRLDPGEVLERLGQPGARLVIAGNLPYNVSKPVTMWLFEHRRRVDRAVLMFQREVAERLTARPGRRRYGPLGILVGEAFRVERLFDLGPGAFRPRPAIVSTVTRWRRHGGADRLGSLETPLRACLRACFARRRRTLLNNLRSALGGDEPARRLLETAGLDGGSRAEELAPAAFRRLAELWPSPDDPRSG